MNLPRLQLAAACAFLTLCTPLHAESADIANDHRRPHQASFDDLVMNFDGAARIVVKTMDGSGVRAQSGLFAFMPAYVVPERSARYGLDARQIRLDVSRANTLLQNAGVVAHSLIDDSESELARAHHAAEAYWGHEVAELASYAQIVFPPESSHTNLTQVVNRLNELAIVEVAYLEPAAQPFILSAPEPPTSSCDSKPKPADLGSLVKDQGYLSAPPLGVNALAAQMLPGGQGENIRVIDIEAGLYPHADLPQLFMTVGEMYQSYGDHGTSVIGVLGAKNNGYGTTGIAPKSSIGFRSIFNSNLFDDWSEAMIDEANVASNIYWAGKHSMKGVVLIELQRLGPVQDECPCTAQKQKCLSTPVEFWPADFDAIQTAVGNGVTIVEAAANGGRNLDHPVFEGAFDRDKRDSGAILVTGSMSDGVTPKCHYGSPNHGSRVDLHSWGEDVATTGGTLLYNGPGFCYDYSNNFNGSSSASAIVAGVVTSLQGAHLHAFGAPTDPLSVRKVLTGTGTPQAIGTEDMWIGSQPDLLRAIAEFVE